jgi:predicted CoA-binding protein
MARMPASVAEFLDGKRLAVAGVSRDPRQAANAIYRKLRDAGHEVYAVNPAAEEVEGARCYPAIAALPQPVHGLVIAAPPQASAALVRECAEHGVKRVWMHRLMGQGSVSAEAVRECGARGVGCIAGGCPLMYVAPVDAFHRCARWLLGLRGRAPR